MVTPKGLLWPVALTLVVALAVSCGGDDSPTNGDGSDIPSFETLPPPVAPTPLSEVVCPVDIPSVSLRSADADQLAVVISAEWTGEDCSFFGGGYTYIPAQPVEVAASESVTLILREEPLSLTAFAWMPDLSGAELISSGQLAVPMQPSNVGRRSVTIPLSLAVASEQPLPISPFDPGDYIIELTGTWSGGLATLALRVAVS